jgi:hypothetical protein
MAAKGETNTGRESDDAAVWFYREIVQPTVAESLTERDSVRRGVLACIVLTHMADHYFHARKPVAKKDEFQEELRKNGAFRLIEDVTNGTKHVKRVTKSGKVIRLGFEDIVAQEINLGNLHAGWPISGKEVMVEDGKNIWLLAQLITIVDEMWRTKLDLL